MRALAPQLLPFCVGQVPVLLEVLELIGRRVAIQFEPPPGPRAGARALFYPLLEYLLLEGVPELSHLDKSAVPPDCRHVEGEPVERVGSRRHRLLEEIG